MLKKRTAVFESWEEMLWSMRRFLLKKWLLCVSLSDSNYYFCQCWMGDSVRLVADTFFLINEVCGMVHYCDCYYFEILDYAVSKLVLGGKARSVSLTILTICCAASIEWIAMRSYKNCDHLIVKKYCCSS